MTIQRGFTLIEMAIVLVIITILIGGLAVPLSAQIQARRIAETNRTLDEVREALIGYAMSHRANSTCACTYSLDLPNPPTVSAIPTTCLSLCPISTLNTDDVVGVITLPISPRLPCPDKLDDEDPLTTDDGDGVADHVGANPNNDCASQFGYLPWVTLGVGSQDAWGNRLRYMVSPAFSRSTGFSNSDFGDLRVCDSSANVSPSDCTSGNVADKVPIVILSHGPNGWWALNVSGSMQALLGGNGEKENASPDSEFVSSPPYKPADGSVAEQSKEFDDLVRWISEGQIKGRVCPAGGCP